MKRPVSGQLNVPITRGGRRLTSPVTDRTTPSLPLSVLRQASRRLQAVCVVLFTFLSVGWLGGNWLDGDLRSEFTDPLQFGPGLTMMTASLIVLALVRSPRLSPHRVITVGLVYQVIISFCIPISEYWTTFRGMTAGSINDDVVGLSMVAVWMLFFAVLVPARPRHALVALVLSGASVPATMGLLARVGDAPELPAEQFIAVFVFPYAAVVVMSYIAARIIYGLGRDVLQAEELGSYQLQELLGRGGMGEVWKATHTMLARPAAIKLIRADILEDDPDGLEVAIRRFEREAQATASLQSPHTVELYDYGVSDDGSFYYVMELLDGIDLESIVERFGPLPAERVVHILSQACLSLGEAHRRGLIHRDLKPANMYLCQRAFEADFLKILDFGLVRQTAVASQREEPLTKTGLLAGTPGYMAPEMAMGDENMDGRVDIYALGCVAYKLLSGHRVFEEKNAVATIFAHVNTAPQALSSVSEMVIPRELDELILACLSKNPDDRPREVQDVAHELARMPLPHPWTRERAAEWWRTHLPETLPV